MPNSPLSNPYDKILNSTNYNKNFALEVIFPVYRVYDIQGGITMVRDYFGSEIARRIRQVRQYYIYQYNFEIPMTTLSYQYYGNTTCSPLIMMYNGIMHPLEITPGSVIKIPEFNEMSSILIEQKTTNNVGKTVLV